MLAAADLVTSQRIAAAVILGGLVVLILELVRRKHLMERYALLWLFAAAVLLLFVLWRGLLTTLAFKLGIHYPPSALFAVALALGLALLVHFSLAISRLTDQNKVMAQRIGILQERIDDHQRKLAAADAPRASSSSRPSTGATTVMDDEELSRAG